MTAASESIYAAVAECALLSEESAELSSELLSLFELIAGVVLDLAGVCLIDFSARVVVLTRTGFVPLFEGAARAVTVEVLDIGTSKWC